MAFSCHSEIYVFEHTLKSSLRLLLLKKRPPSPAGARASNPADPTPPRTPPPQTSPDPPAAQSGHLLLSVLQSNALLTRLS